MANRLLRARKKRTTTSTFRKTEFVRHGPSLCRAARVVMISLTKFFTELLRGTTGRIELRRMIWTPVKGRYNQPIKGRLFSRDVDELEKFSRNGSGDVAQAGTGPQGSARRFA